MTTYIAEFISGGIEYVMAYDFKLKKGRAVFDVGRRKTYTLTGVKSVRVAD